jgi:hypothetical protein
MGHSNKKVSRGAVCGNWQINHKGASRFAAFCKIRHGMATYKSDFEGRLWW